MSKFLLKATLAASGLAAAIAVSTAPLYAEKGTFYKGPFGREDPPAATLASRLYSATTASILPLSVCALKGLTM